MAGTVLPVAVPSYPGFCASSDPYVRRDYVAYLQRFEEYSRAVVKVQMEFSVKSMSLTDAMGKRAVTVAVNDRMKLLTEMRALSEKVSGMVESVSAAVGPLVEEKLKSVDLRLAALEAGANAPEVVVQGVEEPSVGCQGIGEKKGKWYLHNKARRARAKLARLKASEGADGLADDETLKTLEAKWRAENELRQFEAERKLRLMRRQDETDLARLESAKVLRATETAKVGVELAYKKLQAKGNVPADGPGSARTVVSDSGLGRSDGNTISPDSSASMQEFRAVQKENLDLRADNEKLEEILGYLEFSASEQYKLAKMKANCKKAYTLDSDGQAEIDTVGSIHADGKFYPTYLHEDRVANPLHRSARKEVPFGNEDILF